MKQVGKCYLTTLLIDCKHLSTLKNDVAAKQWNLADGTREEIIWLLRITVLSSYLDVCS